MDLQTVVNKVSNFIDTTNITDEKELIKALKSNVRIAANVRKEISKLKNKY